VGGALALDAAWLFAAFLVILTLAAIGIAARRFLLERGGGTVECGLRRGPNGSWRLGLASYRPEELWWFGALGLTMRPDVVFPRRDLTVVSRRPPTEAEAASLGPGMIVVECRLGEDSGQFGPAPGQASASGPAGAAGPGDAAGPGGAAGPDGAPGPGGAAGPGGSVELALGEEALTGLLAWLEAAPPGSHFGAAL
jgi:Protein of unknown function (DUF2550)